MRRGLAEPARWGKVKHDPKSMNAFTVDRGDLFSRISGLAVVLSASVNIDSLVTKERQRRIELTAIRAQAAERIRELEEKRLKEEQERKAREEAAQQRLEEERQKREMEREERRKALERQRQILAETKSEIEEKREDDTDRAARLDRERERLLEARRREEERRKELERVRKEAAEEQRRKRAAAAQAAEERAARGEGKDIAFEDTDHIPEVRQLQRINVTEGAGLWGEEKPAEALEDHEDQGGELEEAVLEEIAVDTEVLEVRPKPVPAPMITPWLAGEGRYAEDRPARTAGDVGRINFSQIFEDRAPPPPFELTTRRVKRMEGFRKWSYREWIEGFDPSNPLHLIEYVIKAKIKGSYWRRKMDSAARADVAMTVFGDLTKELMKPTKEQRDKKQRDRKQLEDEHFHDLIAFTIPTAREIAAIQRSNTAHILKKNHRIVESIYKQIKARRGAKAPRKSFEAYLRYCAAARLAEEANQGLEDNMTAEAPVALNARCYVAAIKALLAEPIEGHIRLISPGDQQKRLAKAWYLFEEYHKDLLSFGIDPEAQHEGERSFEVEELSTITEALLASLAARGFREDADTSERLFDMATKLWTKMGSEFRFVPTPNHTIYYLRCCANAFKFDVFQTILGQFEERTELTYALLLRALARQGRVELMEKTYRDLCDDQKSIGLTALTFTRLVEGYCIKASSSEGFEAGVKGVGSVWRRMLKANVEPPLPVYQHIVRALTENVQDRESILKIMDDAERADARRRRNGLIRLSSGLWDRAISRSDLNESEGLRFDFAKFYFKAEDLLRLSRVQAHAQSRGDRKLRSLQNMLRTLTNKHVTSA